MHALCSKTIKEELNQQFPGIKFSVRSKSYLNGNKINISWSVGVTHEQVQKITMKYQHGYVDKTNNFYHYTGPNYVVTTTGNIEELPSVKFIKLAVKLR
jgi:hypothetical protein